MSAREFGVTGDARCAVNQEGDRGPMPHQLKEVIDLVNSTNQRIEDCAVEWQAKISQAQWRILDSKPVDNKPWEESVLARTYFADKTLDDAFQSLLRHNKNFTDHVQNFVALIRGEEPALITRQTCNAQSQCSEHGIGDEEQLLARSSLLSSLDLSVLGKTQNTQNGRIDCDSILTKAQESFTDLIKAKINFDTKFLGFEATLNGNICSSSDPSLGLCQVCSKILGCGTGRGCKSPRNRRNVIQYRKKTRRSSRIKHKRLAAKKVMIKDKEKNLVENMVEESAQEHLSSNNQSSITIDEI